MAEASAFLLILCTYASDGRAAETGSVSATADATAVIRRGIEVRQDGSVRSRELDRYEPTQVNVSNCDPEALRAHSECVMLIYEMQ